VPPQPDSLHGSPPHQPRAQFRAAEVPVDQGTGDPRRQARVDADPGQDLVPESTHEMEETGSIIQRRSTGGLTLESGPRAHALNVGSIARLWLVARHMVGCVAQLVERRSLTGELPLSCARPAADG